MMSGALCAVICIGTAGKQGVDTFQSIMAAMEDEPKACWA